MLYRTLAVGLLVLAGFALVAPTATAQDFAQATFPHPQMGPVPDSLWSEAPIPTVAAAAAFGDDQGYADAFYFLQAVTYFTLIAVSNPGAIQQLQQLSQGAVAGAWVPAYVAGAAYLYLLTANNGAGQASLLRRDPATGDTMVLADATPPAGFGWTAMTFSVATGLLYAIATNCTGIALLYSINPLTGAMSQLAQLVGTLCVISMAAGLGAYALMLDVELDQLFLLNLVTFAVIALSSPLGFDAAFAQGMGYSFALNRHYLAAVRDPREPFSGGPVGELYEANVDGNGMPDGSTTFLGPIGDGNVEALYYAFTVPETTAAEPDAVPGSFSLSEVYPNPFTPEASFTLTLDRPASVRVVVYDARGRAVQTLHDGPLPTGSTPFHLRSADLPSGLYLIRATGDAVTATRRATLVR